MEDQAKLMEQDLMLSTGSIIEVEVDKIKSEDVIVLLKGYGRDGIIPFKELTYAEDLDNTLNQIKVGDIVKAKVIKLRNDDGYVVLSRLELIKESTFDKLEEIFKNEEILTLNVKEALEKGLVANFNGVRIFIPASQIDTRFVKNTKEFIGKTLKVKIIDFSRKNPTKVVASSRVLLEAEKNEKELLAWNSLNLNDIVKAEIKRFTNFGAFAEVNGIDGLIHMSQISWKHVKSADEVLKQGQLVDVKIINLDKENKKLSLSIKALTDEPWTNVDEKYPIGSPVLGKVVRIADFGAFVELEPGLDGLVHISKISHNHIKHPSEVLSVGDEVKCIILDINKETKKLALSIRDTE